jgi:hypothetical protein
LTSMCDMSCSISSEASELKGLHGLSTKPSSTSSSFGSHCSTPQLTNTRQIIHYAADRTNTQRCGLRQARTLRTPTRLDMETSNTTTTARSFANCKQRVAEAVKHHVPGLRCGRLLYEAAHDFFLHMTVCGDAHKQLVGKLEPDHDPLVGEFLQLQNDEACDQTFRLKDA